MMLNTFLEMFTYPFIQKAFIVGSLVAFCCALLGVILVLKRYSMIGDGLSHVAFGALSVAVAFNLAPLKVSIPVVIIAAFLLLKISENAKIKGDAAIGLISTVSLAIGVIAISVTKGMNTDITSYMFGSILAMSNSDVILSIVLSIVVLFIFILFYNKIFAVTFDENFTKAIGIKVEVLNIIISFLTAVTIVLGMRIMGALLISSLIIFPALTSMRVFKTFKSVVISSAIISIICLCLGIIISYIFSIPTGASIVIMNAILFIVFTLIGNILKA